jgi:formylglycine-generating enzyme required for sulfatase activity
MVDVNEPPRCCAGGTRDAGTAAAPDPPLPGAQPGAARSDRPLRGQVRVPGATFVMGDAFDEGYPADGERPLHSVTLSAFAMDATTVTNAAFATFVKATGYRTDAERYGSSAVFHLAYGGDGSDVRGAPRETPWWLEVSGACWRHPEGQGSDVSRRQNHPVVHVSHNDALAYAAWAGKRLPTEAEWEYAARGGLPGARYVWGDELRPRGRWLCNIFQGDFPRVNTGEDGYLTTAPVKAFAANGFGLHQMAGNVWEWCADWFGADYYQRSPAADPPGPASGDARVMRGGSYLCHDSYCNRYRVAARSSNTPESSSANLGFRCAVSLDA